MNIKLLCTPDQCFTSLSKTDLLPGGLREKAMEMEKKMG